MGSAGGFGFRGAGLIRLDLEIDDRGGGGKFVAFELGLVLFMNEGGGHIIVVFCRGSGDFSLFMTYTGEGGMFVVLSADLGGFSLPIAGGGGG